MFFFSNHPDSHAIIVEQPGRWQDVYAWARFHSHLHFQVYLGRPVSSKALTSSSTEASVADGAYGIYVSWAASVNVFWSAGSAVGSRGALWKIRVGRDQVRELLLWSSLVSNCRKPYMFTFCMKLLFLGNANEMNPRREGSAVN